MTEETTPPVNDTLPATTELLPPAQSPEIDVARVASQVALPLLGGLAVGLVIGTLLPGSKRRKLSKKAGSLAAIAGELGSAFLAQASDVASKGSDKASKLADSISDTVKENAPDLDKIDLDKQVEELSKQAQEVGKQAQQVASAAADQLNDATKALARQAIKWVEKVRG